MCTDTISRTKEKLLQDFFFFFGDLSNAFKSKPCFPFFFFLKFMCSFVMYFHKTAFSHFQVFMYMYIFFLFSVDSLKNPSVSFSKHLTKKLWEKVVKKIRYISEFTVSNVQIRIIDVLMIHS